MAPIAFATYTAWVVLNQDEDALRLEYVYDGWEASWVSNWAYATTFGTQGQAYDEARDHYAATQVAKVVCRVEEIHKVRR